jgi:hypothetical protein
MNVSLDIGQVHLLDGEESPAVVGGDLEVDAAVWIDSDRVSRGVLARSCRTAGLLQDLDVVFGIGFGLTG